MKMTHALGAFLVVCSLTTSSRLLAQLAPADSLVYVKAVHNAIALYHQSLGFQSALYNASAYLGYPFYFKEGHPFFNADQPDTGSIVYDGLLFEKKPLQYNEIADVVVIHLNGSAMQLVSEKVSRFSIFNNQFARLTKDSSENGYINDGFYNLLYEGRVSLLGKEIKTIREDIKGGEEGIWRFADKQNTYYVRMGNRFYPVRSKNDALRIFASRKTELRQYLRANKIKFRKSRVRALTLLTAYFDRLEK